VVSNSIWIAGPTRSGKTTYLIQQFSSWVQGELSAAKAQGRRSRQTKPEILVFAANDDNRRDLADRLASAVKGKYPVISRTPLGFFQDEVMLFWPLLIQKLNLRAQFPLRLRPETEQELATQLWSQELEQGNWQQTGMGEYRLVRRILDLLQLAAIAGIPIEDIPSILEQGFPPPIQLDEEVPPDNRLIPPMLAGKLLQQWREWCWQRGLLTYGLICELYWRHLLPDAQYQQHLQNRYLGILADDTDDYPAIARDLFEVLLDGGAVGAFTYNPDGLVRLGLNADPEYLAGLKHRCQIENLLWRPVICLADSLGHEVVQMVADPNFIAQLPDPIQSIQTVSRAQLLRRVAETIAEAVKNNLVEPQEIAIVAPGLDAIARYTLVEILANKGIAIEQINDQRPLNAFPIVRALLTLLALVYPGLGRLVDRDAIAEMLVVLSQPQNPLAEEEGIKDTWKFTADIDPVRAGLLADYCYQPDPEQPRLLPAAEFSRWDRLGHRATTDYTKIVEWLEVQRSQQTQRLIPNCIVVLDRAIQQFFFKGSQLPYEQLAALRELIETAQHYWDVDARIRQSEQIDSPFHTTIAKFIQLLRQGTITANPYPVRPLGIATPAVTLATIFQYRASRRNHRWQFWLDAGSTLWSKGGAAALYGAFLFLKDWSGNPWTAEDILNTDEQRLQRILPDLLGRANERVYLCHSDLATNGQEQNGPLITLVNAATPLTTEKAIA